MWPILVGVLVVLFAGLILFIATRPATFRIERNAQIEATPSTVFAIINNLHDWGQWSPWEKLDPAMKKSFESPSSGVGAISSWEGNKKVGAGRMTIVETKTDDFVAMKLEFFRPFKATNQSRFQLIPSGNSTKVVWSMDGKNDFMGKAFSMLMNIDKMVGKDFEEGLANLNRLAQTKK